jgi:hypothetical protein
VSLKSPKVHLFLGQQKQQLMSEKGSFYNVKRFFQGKPEGCGKGWAGQVHGCALRQAGTRWRQR